MKRSPKTKKKVRTAPLKVHGGASESDSLSKLIHERTRLAIISALAVNPSLSFNELKALLNVTDGNLSVHARKLEDARYIHCKKSFEGRMPKTVYKITRLGQQALEQYLAQMEALIQNVRAK
jgi:DNA-binding MarR family transcriptional regulator